MPLNTSCYAVFPFAIFLFLQRNIIEAPRISYRISAISSWHADASTWFSSWFGSKAGGEDGEDKVSESAVKSTTLLSSSGKNYSCPDCQKDFLTRWELERHHRTHTGEKPYPCPVCPYRASQKNSLSIHMRTHSGEKPYGCHLCPYRATQKIHLQNHIRTHSSDKGMTK
ncbi:hypothetical protein SK128_005433 [Halocaridina rubra]|uniref:C2H2-type domain-containing protein n=1 Tax=Halocaridina rubra TaxID=373956 RepID=A0AAN8XHN2_HALRR